MTNLNLKYNFLNHSSKSSYIIT